jgi:hypothetical protein
MIFYRFHEVGGRAVVITSDQSGTNLPKGSTWKADGQTEVSPGGRPRLGSTPEAIVEAIERDGYFLGAMPSLHSGATPLSESAHGVRPR